MKLDEIMDTKIDNLSWKSHGRFKLAGFIYEDLPYTIQIEKKQIQNIAELKNKNTAEVSFFRTNIDNSDVAHATLGDVNFPFKIYGAIANAISSEFVNYDAFYFIADKKHSSSAKEYDAKVRIYGFIADKVIRGVSGCRVYSSEDSYGTEFIVSKIKIVNKLFIDEQLIALEAYNVAISENPTLLSRIK